MVSVSAFQADDAGSIPVTRLNKKRPVILADRFLLEDYFMYLAAK